MITGFVLVLGPKSAGKTSILRRIVTGSFSEHEPTLGFMEEQIAKVRVIEIGGQTQFQEYWDIIIEQKPSHIFFVIDITNNHDLDELDKFLTIKDIKKSYILSKLTVCANKIDIMDKKQNDISNYKKFSIIRCSAKTGEGMMDIMEQIARYKDDLIDKTVSTIENRNIDDIKADENEKIRKIKEKYSNKL